MNKQPFSQELGETMMRVLNPNPDVASNAYVLLVLSNEDSLSVCSNLAEAKNIPLFIQDALERMTTDAPDEEYTQERSEPQ